MELVNGALVFAGESVFRVYYLLLSEQGKCGPGTKLQGFFGFEFFVFCFFFKNNSSIRTPESHRNVQSPVLCSVIVLYGSETLPSIVISV